MLDFDAKHLEIVKAGKDAIAKHIKDRCSGETVGFRLERANLSNLDLSGVDLSNAILRYANLEGCILRDAKLDGSILFQSNMRYAKLENASFSGDLTGADLSYSNLSGAKFKGSEMWQANLSYSNLTDTDFARVNLIDTSFRGAKLVNTILPDEIWQIDFTDAKFEGIDFSNSTMGRNSWFGVDLNSLVGVGSAKHTGPSRVDFGTVHALQGNISVELEAFLRGCGLEAWEIEAARLHDAALTPEEVSERLTTRVFAKRTPGAFYLGGVFLSYSHSDSKFVDKLYNALKGEDVTVYIDRHDFTSGSLEKNISRAIRINDQVVVVLSKDSLSSDWVWDEIATALEKEKKIGKAVLFPIALDESCFKDPPDKKRLMRKLRERLILDFSNNRTFKTNLDKLIRGMKVNQ